MRQFNSLEAAKSFIAGLNIPENEIEKIEEYPHLFRPYDVRLKWADCDIIAVIPNWVGKNPNKPNDPPYKHVYEVQKRCFGGPISASEALGMMPNRYKTPKF